MHGNSMNTSVRNNLKLLKKRDKLKNRLGGYDASKTTEYNFPKASSKQLRDIKKKMKEERRNWWFNVIMLTLINFTFVAIIFYCVIKYIF
ncbi:hypothetical protein BTO05_11450 [Winogradskyella sp. PC-19]|jgi:hypothetical protein|uniref:hypothetical protein n=1 Tax=unclassified Winogradskyella TaxID=2615021 RepID=UPI000B3C846C|nr:MULTISPECIES: hypothetical protein [unclassified Winogradskyella]ARV10221.1 hypothetical protein BTO05_11450 [Winogradskyella sp. PC-19]